VNYPEIDPIEADLRRHKPAEPPEALMARLKRSRSVNRQRDIVPELGFSELWWFVSRWLLPATAIVVVGLFLGRSHLHRPIPQREPELAVATPAVTADDVQIQRELVNAFDTVARLPSGEPVRFRCREWMDDVVLRDKARGVTVQQRTPRFEVVPVRFETY